MTVHRTLWALPSGPEDGDVPTFWPLLYGSFRNLGGPNIVP